MADIAYIHERSLSAPFLCSTVGVVSIKLRDGPVVSAPPGSGGPSHAPKPTTMVVFDLYILAVRDPDFGMFPPEKKDSSCVFATRNRKQMFIAPPEQPTSTFLCDVICHMQDVVVYELTEPELRRAMKCVHKFFNRHEKLSVLCSGQYDVVFRHEHPEDFEPFDNYLRDAKNVFTAGTMSHEQLAIRAIELGFETS